MPNRRCRRNRGRNGWRRSSHWRSGFRCRRWWWCNHELRRRWRRGRTNRRRRNGNAFLLLRNRFQHIARTRDMRKINLGLDFFFAAQRPRGARRRRVRFRRPADVGPYFFCFVLLERTGMRLLLGDSDKRQRIENGFTLNFQLPGEIVDSNLTHPAFLLRVLAYVFIAASRSSACCTRT